MAPLWLNTPKKSNHVTVIKHRDLLVLAGIPPTDKIVRIVQTNDTIIIETSRSPKK